MTDKTFLFFVGQKLFLQKKKNYFRDYINQSTFPKIKNKTL